jgi:hypothetical protein
MRNSFFLLLSALILTCTWDASVAKPGIPNLGQLEQVAHLPRELPQRVMGLAYDGQKLWATIYLGHGIYATLDPATLTWQTSIMTSHQEVIKTVSGAFESPGGICFNKDRLWITGSYGESFGVIDLNTWKVERLFKGKQREDRASQAYSSVTFDGHNLWIAWHWFRYDLPVSDTQLLLKVDPETGQVVNHYPLPAGTRNDATHGLTWDGSRLWHMKDQLLTAIDPVSGEVTARYVLHQLKRPSGLAWANNALWIVEFRGNVWRLRFAD